MKCNTKVFIKSVSMKSAKAMPPDQVGKTLILARAGDSQAVTDLITGHIGFAASIAGRVASDFPVVKHEDILGVALQTLVEVTNRIANGELMREHDEYIKYLYVQVFHKCREYANEDHTIRPVSRSLATLKEIAEDSTEYSERLKPYNVDMTLDLESQHLSSFLSREEMFSREIELEDQLVAGHLTPLERTIICKRLEGITYTEIGKEVNMSSVQLSRLVKEMKPRLLACLGLKEYEVV